MSDNLMPLADLTEQFWQRESDWWTTLANEEVAMGNQYQAHAYRTAAHAIRMARDHALASPSTAEARGRAALQPPSDTTGVEP